jgi:hypothetical protein
MTWTQGDVWQAEVMLPAGQRIEYKYVILEEQVRGVGEGKGNAGGSASKGSADLSMSCGICSCRRQDTTWGQAGGPGVAQQAHGQGEAWCRDCGIWHAHAALPRGPIPQDWTKLENEDAEGLVEVTYRSGSDPGEPPDVQVGGGEGRGRHTVAGAREGRGCWEDGAHAARGRPTLLAGVHYDRPPLALHPGHDPPASLAACRSSRSRWPLLRGSRGPTALCRFRRR